jgi:ATP-dependent RNA helicase RhlE
LDMKFEEYRIAQEIKRNLANLEFKRPTDIQYKAIPNILKGEDVLAIAQTGTGKTAAFAIPVTHLIIERKRKSRTDGIRCLVMVPTRELATQIATVFNQVSKGTGIEVLSLTGGVEQDPQISKLQKGVDILIATPGRVFDLHSQGHLLLNRIEILVLDEADHMLDLGFIKDIRDLLDRLPKNRQTLFFSATINEEIKKLAYSMVRNAIRIQISPDNKVSRNITHSVAFIEMDDKRFFLERIVRENAEAKVLAFVRTKVRAERVCKALERMEIDCLFIHGGMEQKDRAKALSDFKKGTIKVLIATDVSSRGIDIPNVDMVVNYDLPEQAENYVHRVGRTGRGTQKGKAIAFCSKEENALLQEIEEYLGHPINRVDIDKHTYQETVDLTMDTDFDMNELRREMEAFENTKKKKKK